MQLKLAAGVCLVLAVTVGGAAKPRAAIQVDDSQPAEGRQPPAKIAPDKPPRTDLYGDPLPPGALARLGTVRFRSAPGGSKIVFSRDGKVLSRAVDRKFYSWDAATGRPLRHFSVGVMNADAFDLSADGKIAATAWWTSLTLWDATIGKPIRTIERQKDEGLQGLALSPDGKLVASASQRNKARMIFLWEVKTGKELLTLPVTGSCCFGFSPDGKSLVSADAEFLRFWEVATGQDRKLAMHEKGLTCLAFSDDGQLLALGGAPGTIWFWEAARPTEVRKLQGDQGWTHSLALSPTGQVLASAGERGLRLLDVATGKELPPLQNRPESASSVAFSPDGKILAAAAPVIRLWDLTTRKELHPREAHQLWINSLAFSPDGKTIATAGPDRTIRFWDAVTGKPLRVLSGPADNIDSVAFCPDGDTLVSECFDNTVRVWQVSTGKEIRQFSFGNDRPPLYQRMGMVLSADGKTVTEVSRGMHVNVYGLTQVHTWEVATGRLLLQRREPLERDERVVPQGLSPDGRLLVLEPLPTKQTGSKLGKPLVLWDIARGRNLVSLQSHVEGSSIYPKVFSPDSKTVAGAYFEPVFRDGEKTFESRTRLWEVATGKKVVDLPIGPDRCLAFSNDCRVLAVGGDANISLWDVASGRQLLRLQGYEGGLYTLAFSRDGKRLASGHGDTTALIWDLTVLGDRGPLGERGVLTPRSDGKELEPRRIDQLWTDLAGDDAPKAHAAIWAFVASPKSATSALAERVRLAEAVDSKKLAQILGDLDNPRFPVREAAAKELAKLTEQVEPALRQALERKPSAEVRRRLESILSAPAIPAGETLRTLRAIQVLEYIGTSEAQRVLKALASGAPEARPTEEAKAALERLARRAPSTP
jgi:WD40 repeat protein